MGVSSLAAYNGSGTQGTAVTNTITTSDDGDVQSVFWNANDTTRVLLFGSSINEIPTSGGSNKSSPYGGVQIFTVNNDLDALGDLYLQISLTMPSTLSTLPAATDIENILGDDGDYGDYDPDGNGSVAIPVSVIAQEIQQLNNNVSTVVNSPMTFDVANGTSANEISYNTAVPVQGFKPYGITSLVKRVEFMVGTQVWQTMEYDDIISALNTEMNEGNYNEVVDQSMGMLTSQGNRYYGPRANGLAPAFLSDTYRSCIKLPLLTKTINDLHTKFANATEDGYLMAAAPHQQVKVRVYYSDGSDVFSSQEDIQAIYPGKPPSSGQLDDLTAANTDISWYIAQYMAAQAKANFTNLNATGVTFNTTLLGKHQIMSNAERQQLKNMPQGLPKRIKMTQNALYTASQGFAEGKTIVVDLDHFSLYASYLVIRIDYGETIQQLAGVQASGGNFLVQNRLNIPGIKSAELLLNSTSVSGILPGTFLTNSAADSLGIFSNSAQVGSTSLKDYYIFPLASHAYDGSAIPLNRFDNIRLKIVPDSASAPNKTGKISVTCFGETTALYRGGAASLAMY